MGLCEWERKHVPSAVDWAGEMGGFKTIMDTDWTWNTLSETLPVANTYVVGSIELNLN